MFTFSMFGPRWWQHVTGLLCLVRPCAWEKESTHLGMGLDRGAVLHSWWCCRRCGQWWNATRRVGDPEPTPFTILPRTPWPRA